MSTSQYYGWLWTETSAVKKKITKQKKKKKKKNHTVFKAQ